MSRVYTFLLVYKHIFEVTFSCTSKRDDALSLSHTGTSGYMLIGIFTAVTVQEFIKALGKTS